MDIKNDINLMISNLQILLHNFPDELNEKKSKILVELGVLLKEVNSVSVIDWQKIKNILQIVSDYLSDVVMILPSGLIKMILQGIINAIAIIISMLPNS
jgi:hypothetical protein